MENTLIIEKLIKKLSEKYTVILTTHNEEQAKRIADRTILIGK
jgi:phosphate import ATP-binding protein pstB 1